jgi:hypothetical protein
VVACGEFFGYSGVRSGFLGGFLRGSGTGNAAFLSQKRGQNVVVAWWVVVLSMVVFSSSFGWSAGDDLGGCRETHRTEKHVDPLHRFRVAGQQPDSEEEVDRTPH